MNAKWLVNLPTIHLEYLPVCACCNLVSFFNAFNMEDYAIGIVLLHHSVWVITKTNESGLNLKEIEKERKKPKLEDQLEDGEIRGYKHY
jgi:hypothetical protein